MADPIPSITELKEGGLYALSFEDRLPMAQLHDLKERWKEKVGDHAGCIILAGGIQVQELDDEHLKQLGLKRIEEEDNGPFIA